MNKSVLTNAIAGGAFVVAYLLPDSSYRQLLLQASLFALSGALTNWLAIHMLFEKVPFLYGSGVIPNRFEEFKTGIRTLILDNFFTPENFAKFAEDSLPSELPTDSIAGQVDYDLMFDGFMKVVSESQFGQMLSMFGGTQALEPLRDPFKVEAEKQVKELMGNMDFSQVLQIGGGYEQMRPKIEHMIDNRLAELTPRKVKEIVSDMIRQHLGWLVVWGGVFGALMGVLSVAVL